MPHLVPDPARLLLAARQGEPGAAAALVDAWLPVVLGWCNRLCGPSVNPEDVAQDVMIKTLTHMDDIRDPDRLSGWLFRVTRSIIRQRRRSAWLRGWIPGATVEGIDPSSDPLARAESNETARRVRLALEELPAPQREAIVLCDLEGRTADEAASLIGVSTGTVKSRLRLGRQRFQRAAIRLGLATRLLDAHDRGAI